MFSKYVQKDDKRFSLVGLPGSILLVCLSTVHRKGTSHSTTGSENIASLANNLKRIPKSLTVNIKQIFLPWQLSQLSRINSGKVNNTKFRFVFKILMVKVEQYYCTYLLVTSNFTKKHLEKKLHLFKTQISIEVDCSLCKITTANRNKTGMDRFQDCCKV